MTAAIYGLQMLVPVDGREVEFGAQTPDYQNLSTGEMGKLIDLSYPPGAVWRCTWIPGRPLFMRQSNGLAVQVPDEFEKEARKAGGKA